jgi:hypothetical protein
LNENEIWTKTRREGKWKIPKPTEQQEITWRMFR